MNVKAKPLQIRAEVAGFITLKKYKSALNELTGEMDPVGAAVEELSFHNLVTDTGLDQIWGAPTGAYGFAYLYNRCVVGTGNTTPAFTDTSLVSQIADAGSLPDSQSYPTTTYVAGPPAYWKAVQTYRFGTGAAAGNIAEIGFYPTNGSSSSGLFSRALILDSEGNPTTITVESDEILDVTYEFRVYLDTSDTVGTFESDGVTYDTIIRGADIDTPPSLSSRLANNSDGFQPGVTVYDGTIGSLTSTPSGSSYAVSYHNSGTWATYSPGSHVQSFTTVVPVGSANWANGVRSIYVAAPYFKVQIQFTDPITGKGIPKVTGEKMSISIQLSWGRYNAA